jgi:hypothetical protein
MDFNRISNRDMKSDSAAYKLAASASAEKAVKAANERYARTASSLDWYVYTIAVEDFERAKKEAEKEFPKVYQKLRDAYDDMADSTEVTDAQLNYDRDKARFDRGMISQSKLLSSEQALQNAKNHQAKLEIQMWIQLMEYEYGLLK